MASVMDCRLIVGSFRCVGDDGFILVWQTSPDFDNGCIGVTARFGRDAMKCAAVSGLLGHGIRSDSKHGAYARILSFAAVAQLDRVLGYEPRGRGFESCQPRHIP